MDMLVGGTATATITILWRKWKKMGQLF